MGRTGIIILIVVIIIAGAVGYYFYKKKNEYQVKLPNVDKSGLGTTSTTSVAPR